MQNLQINGYFKVPDWVPSFPRPTKGLGGLWREHAFPWGKRETVTSPGSAGGLWGGPHPLLHQKPEWVSVLSTQPSFTNDLSAQALPFSPGNGYEHRSHEKQVLLQGQNESIPTCSSTQPSEIYSCWSQASPSHRSHPGVCRRPDTSSKYAGLFLAILPHPGLCCLLFLTHSMLCEDAQKLPGCNTGQPALGSTAWAGSLDRMMALQRSLLTSATLWFCETVSSHTPKSPKWLANCWLQGQISRVQLKHTQFRWTDTSHVPPLTPSQMLTL